MKAMIFAAGIGSRLKPWTDSHPKALVEVGGKPMLGRVIESLKRVGVTEIVVNVHHFADQIEAYIAKNDNFGVEVHVSDERDRLLDTGGGLLKASTLLQGGEPIILHNADVYTDVDLAEMLEKHRHSKADATLLVAERDSSRTFLFNSEMRLCGWKNHKTGDTLPSRLAEDGLKPFAFGGIHIINDKVLSRLSEYNPKVPFSITPFYANSSKDLEIVGHLCDRPYNWFDVGRPENLSKARACVGCSFKNMC